jgi:hypothetical protein
MCRLDLLTNRKPQHKSNRIARALALPPSNILFFFTAPRRLLVQPRFANAVDVDGTPAESFSRTNETRRFLTQWLKLKPWLVEAESSRNRFRKLASPVAAMVPRWKRAFACLDMDKVSRLNRRPRPTLTTDQGKDPAMVTRRGALVVLGVVGNLIQ